MAPIRCCVLRSAALGALLSVLAASPTPVQGLTGSPQHRGEWKQETSGCICKGRSGNFGYCGYHFHLGSQEDLPWCRTKHGCGYSALTGSWTYCDVRGLERRRAEDGRLYNSKQFKDYYAGNAKGKAKWVLAEKTAEKRMANNDKAYSVFEFRDYYIDEFGEKGWVEEWAKALPEKRQAEDGKWYTWEEFAKYYSDEKAWANWDSAKQARTDL